jgi:hypothetical protein
VAVDFDRDSTAARSRLIRIRQTEDASVLIVQTVPASPLDPEASDGSDGLDGEIPPFTEEVDLDG